MSSAVIGENANTLRTFSTPGCVSRRGLAISLLNRLCWCGLLSGALRPNLATTESTLPDLSTHQAFRDFMTTLDERRRIRKRTGEDWRIRGWDFLVYPEAKLPA
jgi:hypothetical protein